ncbi:hypothetical protein [Acidimangrovimonas sediminis]|uniref:hypothetical protein n=1 Tax=Acidimangrovimonas sediminis TaxID=2056283 RepID=UPI000C7FB279|nr:hypothetical protein [Acidimangrovimonas sediminis]
MISTVINLLILVLLVGVMGYAVLLSRRVSRLMAALDALGPMVSAFSDAVDKSERSVADLRGAADEATARAAGEGGHPAADQAAARDLAARAAVEATALQEAAAPVSFHSVRRRPVAGMTRLGGKSELVKSFFDRGRGLDRAPDRAPDRALDRGEERRRDRAPDWAPDWPSDWAAERRPAGAV